MSSQFPQENRYCINCQHHSQLGGFVLLDPRVEQHVCRHPNNVVIDINPVTGDKKYRFETCTETRFDNPQGACGLEGRWYQEKTPVTSEAEVSSQKSPVKEKFVIGDNL